MYSLAGLFFGLAGVMQMSRLRQGDPTVAIGTELDVIAAVVIGGGSLSGGEGSILGAMGNIRATHLIDKSFWPAPPASTTTVERSPEECLESRP